MNKEQDNSPKPSKRGYLSLPFSLKILFLVAAFDGFNSIVGRSIILEMGYPFLGMTLKGYPALIALILLNQMGAILVCSGLWLRKKWVWYVALAYLAILLLNWGLEMPQKFMEENLLRDATLISEETGSPITPETLKLTYYFAIGFGVLFRGWIVYSLFKYKNLFDED